MDSTLLIWIGCIIGAVIGLKSSLFNTLIFMWKLVFGLYLSIWSYDFVSGLIRSMPAVLVPWKSLLIIAVIFCIVVGGLTALVKNILKDREPDFEFPSMVNYIGGIFCGGVSGALVTIILMLIYALTPFNNSISVDHGQENAKTVASSIIGLSDTVNGFSFQRNITLAGKDSLNNILKIAIEGESEPKEDSPQDSQEAEPSEAELDQTASEAEET